MLESRRVSENWQVVSSPCAFAAEGPAKAAMTAPTTVKARRIPSVSLSIPDQETSPNHAQDSDPRCRAHAVRKDGRRTVDPRGPGPRRYGDRRGARARRGGPGPGPGCGLRAGAPGGPGPNPLAPGADQGRHPQGGALGDDQQGL